MKSLTQNLSFLCVAMLIGFSQMTYAESMSHEPSSSEIHKHMNDKSVVLNFTKGQHDLTQMEQTKLGELISKIGMSNIDKVEVAAWSDKNFPKKGKDLSQADVKLANERISAIQDYLKTKLTSSKIQTFNMAESSHWLARALRTDQAELKSIFAKEASAPMAREDFNIIENHGAASKAVVVVVPMERKMAEPPASAPGPAY